MNLFKKREPPTTDQSLQNEVNRLSQAIRDYGKSLDAIMDAGLPPFESAKALRKAAKMAREFSSELEK